jgi:hypothetical protein
MSAKDINLQFGRQDIALAQEQVVAQAAVAAAVTNTGAAQGGATEKQKAFTREGRMMAAMLLSEINPALGSMVMVLAHVARGIGEIGPGLVALAGGAAVLGGIVAIFQQMKAEAEAIIAAVARGREANRAAREEGAGQRTKLAQEAWAAGLYGRAGEIQRESAALQGEGVIAPVADSAALARAFAGREGITFNPDQYMRGLTTRGMRPIDFGQDRAKARAELRRVLEAGNTAEGERALASAMAETGLDAQLNAPDAAGNRVDPLDVAMRRLRQARPDLKPEERTAVERMIREGVLTLQDPGHAAMHRGIVRPGLLDLAWAGSDIERARAGFGGTQTVGELMELAGQVAENSRAIGRGGGGERIPTTQPVNVNIRNESHVTNVDTMYGGPPVSPGAYFRAYEQEPGGGIEN